jgi:hypothetical protein
MLELAKRELEEGSCKRKVATEIGIDESTMRKRLEAGNGVTALGRYNQFLLKHKNQN